MKTPAKTHPKPPKKRRPLTVPAVADALLKEAGIYARVAKRFGCTREAVKQFCDHHRDVLHPVRKQAKETIVDDAEYSMHKAVVNGEPWAVKLVLETLGRRRGYAPPSRLLSAGELPAGMEAVGLPIVIMLPDNGRHPKGIENGPVIDATPSPADQHREADRQDGTSGPGTASPSLPAPTGDAD